MNSSGMQDMCFMPFVTDSSTDECNNYIVKLIFTHLCNGYEFDWFYLDNLYRNEHIRMK